MKRWIAAMFCVGAGACSKTRAPEPELASKVLLDLELAVEPGVSGMTRASDQSLWLISERSGMLHNVVLADSPNTGRTVAVKAFALRNPSADTDYEGITAIGETTFAVATEGSRAPQAGMEIVAQRENGFDVVGAVAFDASHLGITFTKNHGAEAICGEAEQLFVGFENWQTDADGQRWAPVAVVVKHAAGWAFANYFRLRLLSQRGKLSSLDCVRNADGSWQFTALERHYNTTFVTEFALKSFVADAPAQSITPTIRSNLSQILRGSRNLESIVKFANGEVWVVNDNLSGSVEGKTYLTKVEPTEP